MTVTLDDAKWTFLHLFLAAVITLFCFWLSSAATPVFSMFPILFPKLPLHLGRNLCTKFEWLSECVPFAAIRSAWYLSRTLSNLILVDSSASTMQSMFCLASPNTAVGISTDVYWCFAKHCCWHPTFQLSTNVFSWCSWSPPPQVQWRKHVIFWHCRPLVFRQPNFAFFAFRCIGHVLPHIRPHIVGSWSRLFPRQSLFGPCISVKCFFFNKKNLVKAACIWHFSFSIHVPLIFNLIFQHCVKWCTCYVKWEESSRVTKVPLAESRRLLVVMESSSVIRKGKRKRNNRKK